MTNTKIEACPFCGASAHCTSVSDFRISSPRTGRRVTCDECPANAGAYGTETEAIEAWNRRAAPHQGADALREDAERLDFLQSWAEKSKFLGHKWDTFVFDFVKHTTIRQAIDAARAAFAQHQAPQQGEQP